MATNRLNATVRHMGFLQPMGYLTLIVKFGCHLRINATVDTWDPSTPPKMTVGYVRT